MTTREQKNNLWAAVVTLIAVLALVLLAAGCGGKVNASIPIAQTGAGIEAAKQLGEAAKDQVRGDAPKPVIIRTLDHQAEVLDGAAESNERAAKDAQATGEQLRRLEARWYVIWGQRLQWLILGWAVAGALSVTLLAVAPAGPIGLIARHVLNILPFSNFFTIAARSIQK
jgi:hypothetical protein